MLLRTLSRIAAGVIGTTVRTICLPLVLSLDKCLYIIAEDE